MSDGDLAKEETGMSPSKHGVTNHITIIVLYIASWEDWSVELDR
jgi:hypothetical protein